jgi:stage II sporulation protein D
LIRVEGEPVIRVGLMTGASKARITASGNFLTDTGQSLSEGDYAISLDDGFARLDGPSSLRAHSILMSPADFDHSSLTVHDVTIGINFHWQRKESQQFKGALRVVATSAGLMIINELPLESYLVSVISSEMSAACPAALLRAHAVVSRSWMLAQLEKGAGEGKAQYAVAAQGTGGAMVDSSSEIIRWYDRENHTGFDVCADDHCQRYQGISKAYSREAFAAVRDTRGHVLIFDEVICDTRYSKSCGGMTEIYRAAWEDKRVPYLSSVYDGQGEISGYQMPLADEANAEAWITSSPQAYCNEVSQALLGRILPGFDQETLDFYRWEVSYTQDELREILYEKLGFDAGHLLSLEPIERGESGRIIRLKVIGEAQSLVIGKELEIRRALSRSHLYSSAFVVHTEQGGASGYPERFRIKGAGWGHGVGLCQIGAAVMADQGRTHEEILSHYFLGASLRPVY